MCFTPVIKCSVHFLSSQIVDSDQVEDLADLGIQLIRKWKYLKLGIGCQLHHFIYSSIMVKILCVLKFIAALYNKELSLNLNS